MTHVYISDDLRCQVFVFVTICLWERLGEIGSIVPANVDRNPWAVETQSLFLKCCRLKDGKFSLWSPQAHLLMGNVELS